MSQSGRRLFVIARITPTKVNCETAKPRNQIKARPSSANMLVGGAAYTACPMGVPAAVLTNQATTS